VSQALINPVPAANPTAKTSPIRQSDQKYSNTVRI
jgi:hypothetical protein